MIDTSRWDRLSTILALMNALEQLAALNAQSMDILAFTQGMSTKDLLQAGHNPSDARAIVRLAKVYYPANATRLAAIDAARNNGHSLPTLLMIERYAARLSNKRLAWGFRTRMCRLSGPHSAIKKAAAAEIERLNGPTAPDTTPRFRSISSPIKGRGVVIYGSNTQIAAIENAVHGRAGREASLNDRGEAFFSLWSEGAPTTEYTITVGVTLEETTQIAEGKGNDVTLIAADGARMTGALNWFNKNSAIKVTPC